MCKCDPERKQPFCGVGDCVMPTSTAAPETPPLSRDELDGFLSGLVNHLFPPLYYVLSDGALVGKAAYHKGDEDTPEFVVINPVDFDEFEAAVSETRRLVPLSASDQNRLSAWAKERRIE